MCENLSILCPSTPGRPLGCARHVATRGPGSPDAWHFVDQTKPFAPSDAVAQRQHHALCPDRSFRPPQPVGFPTGGVSPLCSRIGTHGVALAPHQTCRIQLPAFLPSERFYCLPFPPPLRVSASKRPRYYEGSDSLTLSPRPPGLSASRRLAVPTFRPQPRDPSAMAALSCQSPQRQSVCSRLRHT